MCAEVFFGCHMQENRKTGRSAGTTLYSVPFVFKQRLESAHSLCGPKQPIFVMGPVELMFFGVFIGCHTQENRKPGRITGASLYSVPFVPKLRQEWATVFVGRNSLPLWLALVSLYFLGSPLAVAPVLGLLPPVTRPIGFNRSLIKCHRFLEVIPIAGFQLYLHNLWLQEQCKAAQKELLCILLLW